MFEKAKPLTAREKINLYCDRNKLFPSDRVFFLEVLEEAVKEERERCIGVIKHYLLFNNQRAVSWYEDIIEAIRREAQ